MKNPSYRPSGLFNGFTLIELIVVLFLLGIVAAIVLPKIFWAEAALKADAGKVASLITYLAESSGSKRVYYRLIFSLEEGMMRVESSDGAGEYRELEDPRLKRVSLSDRVVFEDISGPGGKAKGGEVSVEFTPSGSSAPFIVHLRSKNDATAYSVVFNPYSSRATVAEGYA